MSVSWWNALLRLVWRSWVGASGIFAWLAIKIGVSLRDLIAQACSLPSMEFGEICPDTQAWQCFHLYL